MAQWSDISDDALGPSDASQFHFSKLDKLVREHRLKSRDLLIRLHFCNFWQFKSNGHPLRQSDISDRYLLERKYLACVSICTRGRCTRRSCSERDETPRATAVGRFVWGSARTQRRGSPLCPRSGPRRVSSVSSSAARLSPNSRILKAQHTCFMLQNVPSWWLSFSNVSIPWLFTRRIERKTRDRWRIHLPFKLNYRRTYSDREQLSRN